MASDDNVFTNAAAVNKTRATTHKQNIINVTTEQDIFCTFLVLVLVPCNFSFSSAC